MVGQFKIVLAARAVPLVMAATIVAAKTELNPCAGSMEMAPWCRMPMDAVVDLP